jgi:hypothetical protein
VGSVLCIRVRDVLDSAYARREERIGKQARGPVTEFRGINGMIGEHLPNGVHFMFGPHDIDKSGLAYQIACECRCPSIMVSTKESGADLLVRGIARLTDTHCNLIGTGRLRSAEIQDRSQRALLDLRSVRIVEAIPGKPLVTLKALTEIVEESKKIDERLLVVIDDIQDWILSGAADVKKRERELDGALIELQPTFAAWNCAILAVCEERYGLEGYHFWEVRDADAEQRTKSGEVERAIEVRIYQANQAFYGNPARLWHNQAQHKFRDF